MRRNLPSLNKEMTPDPAFGVFQHLSMKLVSGTRYLVHMYSTYTPGLYIEQHCVLYSTNTTILVQQCWYLWGIRYIEYIPIYLGGLCENRWYIYLYIYLYIETVYIYSYASQPFRVHRWVYTYIYIYTREAHGKK